MKAKRLSKKASQILTNGGQESENSPKVDSIENITTDEDVPTALIPITITDGENSSLACSDEFLSYTP